MAGRKKENFDRERVEFKADPEWIERVNDAAIRLGFGNLSALIRFVVTQYVDSNPPPLPKKKKGAP